MKVFIPNPQPGLPQTIYYSLHQLRMHQARQASAFAPRIKQKQDQVGRSLWLNRYHPDLMKKSRTLDIRGVR